ncbi:hypothetical protein QZH41_007289 [Actinostola sp. cb2023]|nr:hypothetical protein QZH41_007289 [Actinostola sp. cb2023]
MRERQDNTIQIKDLSTQVMEDILTYLYSGSVILTESNAIELTVAADYMFLHKLKQMGTEFVSQNLTAANCLGVISIAEKYDFQDLRDHAQCYTLENFATVAQAEEFEKLSVEQLLAVISCDDLVAKEVEVYEAVVRWTNFQIDERKKHFDALFGRVRLIFLPRCYILDVVKEEELVADSKREEFRKYLEKAGVLDALTKVLVNLYEEPEKPSNAMEYPFKYVFVL